MRRAQSDLFTCLKGLLLVFGFGLVTWGWVGTSWSIFHEETPPLRILFYIISALYFLVCVASVLTGVIAGCREVWGE